MELLDSYAGPKAHKIQTQITLQNSQHFYSNGARIAINSPSARQEETKDDISFRSKVSVKTPSVTSKATSQISYKSSMTTPSTKDRMVQLQMELEAEKQKRAAAEAEVMRLTHRE
jgi:hypothetical protein